MLNLISRVQTGVYYREGRNSLPGSAAQRSVLCAKAQERDVVCSDSCVVVGHCRQGALAEGLSPRGAVPKRCLYSHAHKALDSCFKT